MAAALLAAVGLGGVGAGLASETLIDGGRVIFTSDSDNGRSRCPGDDFYCSAVPGSGSDVKTVPYNGR